MASRTPVGSCAVCTWERENGTRVDASRSLTAWGAIIGLHRTSISRHFKHAPDHLAKKADDEPVTASYKFETGADDFTGNSAATESPQTEDDVHKFVRDKGMDPDEWDLQWRFSEWEAQRKGGELVTLHAFRVSGKRKDAKTAAVAGNHEAILEAIRSFTFVPESVSYQDSSFIIVPTDLQFGKTDWSGGSKETLEQALNSFHKAAEFVKEYRPREICIVDAGDTVENVFNTSSQLGTNDLDLPHQIVEAAFAMQQGIQILAPHAPSLRYAAVSSNHGAHRIGPKAPAGDAHADYGLAIAKMLGNALKLNDAAFGHVTVQTPEPFMESLYFQTSGSDIGVVHSHQAGNVDKIGDWWKGQTHGNMPVSRARILLAGHWHSLRIQQSGDARWIMVGPASDRGSSWFTNLKGEQSESGMLSFTTADNRWDNLRIL